MYDKHLKIDNSTLTNSTGVFTTVDIPARVPICEMTGNILSEDKLVDPNHPAVLQIGVDRFLSPSGEIDDKFNHSCNPNCKLHIVGNRAILYSLYIIREGSELTFDYSTSSTDTHETWQMNCKCGYIRCRKIISGYQYLSDAIKKDYKTKGMVPLFISDPIFSRK